MMQETKYFTLKRYGYSDLLIRLVGSEWQWVVSSDQYGTHYAKMNTMPPEKIEQFIYENYLEQAGKLMDAETPEDQKRLSELVDFVCEYERIHFPIDKPKGEEKK